MTIGRIHKWEVRSYYEKVSSYYEKTLREMIWTRWLEKLEEGAVLDTIKNWREGLVIDAGCGSGRYTIRLAYAGASVVALDISMNMLRRLRKKIMGWNLPIYLIAGDVEYLPIREKSVDYILCTLTFDHLPNEHFAIKSFSHVLKPKGVILISFLNKYADVFLKVDPRFFPSKNGIHTVFLKFRDEKELVELFREQGMDCVFRAKTSPREQLNILVFQKEDKFID